MKRRRRKKTKLGGSLTLFDMFVVVNSSFTFPFHCDTIDSRRTKIGEIKQHLRLPPRIRNNNNNSHGVDSDFLHLRCSRNIARPAMLVLQKQSPPRLDSCVCWKRIATTRITPVARPTNCCWTNDRDPPMGIITTTSIFSGLHPEKAAFQRFP